MDSITQPMPVEGALTERLTKLSQRKTDIERGLAKAVRDGVLEDAVLGAELAAFRREYEGFQELKTQNAREVVSRLMRQGLFREGLIGEMRTEFGNDLPGLLAIATSCQSAVVVSQALRMLRDLGRDAHGCTRFLIDQMGETSDRYDDFISTLTAIGPAAVPELIGALERQNTQIRRGAVVVLGSIIPRAREAVPALVELLKDPVNLVQDEALSSLAHIGRGAVVHLLKAIDDPQWRGEAVRALAYAVVAPKGHSKKIAVRGLAQVGNDVLPVLVEALNDRHPLVRLGAARVLGYMAPRSGLFVEALARAVRDDEPDVSAAAADALGKNSAICPLLQTLTDSKVHVRRTAVRALVECFDLEKAQYIPAWLELLKDPEPDLREWGADRLAAVARFAEKSAELTESLKEAVLPALAVSISRERNDEALYEMDKARRYIGEILAGVYTDDSVQS